MWSLWFIWVCFFWNTQNNEINENDKIHLMPYKVDLWIEHAPNLDHFNHQQHLKTGYFDVLRIDQHRLIADLKFQGTCHQIVLHLFPVKIWLLWNIFPVVDSVIIGYKHIFRFANSFSFWLQYYLWLGIMWLSVCYG